MRRIVEWQQARARNSTRHPAEPLCTWILHDSFVDPDSWPGEIGANPLTALIALRIRLRTDPRLLLEFVPNLQASNSSILGGNVQSLEKLKPLALLWLRLAVGIIFFSYGHEKLFTATAASLREFPRIGFPPYFVYVAGHIGVVWRPPLDRRTLYARHRAAAGHRNGDRAGARLDPSGGNLRSPRLRASSGPMWSFICTGGRGSRLAFARCFYFRARQHTAAREIAALECAKFLNGGDDIFGLRQDFVFELGLIGAEGVHRRHPAHRRVQIVEKLL